MPSRTKDLADHAGLSHPLLQWRVPTPLAQAILSSSLSSNLLTAPRLVPMVAMVATTPQPSPMPWATRSSLNQSSHTLWKMVPAQPCPLDKLVSQTSSTLAKVLPASSKFSLNTDQLESLSTPPTLSSNTSAAVLLTPLHAVNLWTMPSPLSATVPTRARTTSWWETPGVPAGVSMDTSTSLWTIRTSAVSWPGIHPSPRLIPPRGHHEHDLFDHKCDVSLISLFIITEL